MSWNTQITLDNVDNYLTWLQADLWLTWSANTWTDTNSWAVNTWAVATWAINTGTAANTETINTWNIRVFWENVETELWSGTEFDKALYRMYMNGLTKYDKSDEYRPSDWLTREESAKMIGQLYSQLWFTKEDKWFNCSFVDTNLFDPTLAEHIYSVCRWWVFVWNQNTMQYMPRDYLTKGQLLAVLLRVLEWKLSNENAQPRWIEYYVKAMNIWLTNETNLAKFDQPVSRQEAALLIYRFKNMIVDEIQYQISLSRLSSLKANNDAYLKQIEELQSKRTSKQNLDWKDLIDTTNPDKNSIITSTWSVSSWSDVSLDIIAWNEALTNSPEFIEAINRMYDMWMTSYNTTAAFMPYQTITRAQVAKMLDNFATATNLSIVRNSGKCEFSDVPADSEYKDAITKVCQYWIMVWSNDKFFPDQAVNKAGFVAILIRLFDGKSLDESLNPRWTNYYKRATEIWLLSAQDTVTFTSDIARYEVAIFLYRLNVRLTMYNNLNTSQLYDEIIKTLDETQSINEQWKTTTKVYIDLLALNNSAFTDGYAQIIENRYRIKKSKTSAYNVWTNSFVRYGNLYSIESGDSIGSVTFILTNWALVDGTIRIDQDSYYLTKDPATTTYYTLTQK